MKTNKLKILQYLTKPLLLVSVLLFVANWADNMSRRCARKTWPLCRKWFKGVQGNNQKTKSHEKYIEQSLIDIEFVLNILYPCISMRKKDML